MSRQPAPRVPEDASATPAADAVQIIDKARDLFVSDVIRREDGSATVFISEGLVPVTLPALNPALPEFVTEDETLIEPASFIGYLQHYASRQAICRASLGGNRIEAVLDYHHRAREAPGAAGDHATPGRCRHVVTLLCPFDVDYAKWRPLLGGKFLGQQEFVEFLKDMVHTIHQPAAADLLDIAQDLAIDRVVRYRSARNDRSGNITILYDEQDGAGAKHDGEISLPEHVEIVVPIFQGGAETRITAELRYRLKDGVLLLGLRWPGMEKQEREAFRAIGEKVRNEAAVAVYYVA